MKCVTMCAGPGGPTTERKDSGGVRVPSGHHFELVVVGSLDRLAESCQALGDAVTASAALVKIR